MSAVNSAGNVIQERILDVHEQARLKIAAEMKWPLHDDFFLILPLWFIKEWIYGLDPKEAMLLACDGSFQELLVYKRRQGSLGKIVDWFSRRIRGLNF